MYQPSRDLGQVDRASAAGEAATAAQLSVFIGTKAQYIKTAPLMRLLQQRGIPYRLIDSGQHAAFTPALRRELGVKDPDVALTSKGNIKSVLEAALWFLRYLTIATFQPSAVRQTIFGGVTGPCLVHGDTPSTLLALLLAKRAGLKVAHIEAGLRSFNYVKPFPEELIRIICMRYCDFLFAPSDWAFENMLRMGVKGEKFNAGQNTNVEAMYYALAGAEPPPEQRAGGGETPYALMTIHRVETILNKRRLLRIVELVEEIAADRPVVFVLHDPTERQLSRHGWLDRLRRNPAVTLHGLVDYTRFLSLLDGAEFVVTDGGSIQEECSYMDVPCLVMRGETERQEGLDGNVVITAFDDRIVSDFIANCSSRRRGARIENTEPSKKILDFLVVRMPQ